MNDDQLRQLLRGMPPDEASPGFTDSVLTRVAPPMSSVRQPRRLILAAAAALLLALVAGVGWRQSLRQDVTEAQRASARQAAVERLAALDQERRELASELAQLARLTQRARPMLYVDTLRVEPASNGPRWAAAAGREIDLVIDLAAVARRRASTQATPINLPATYQGDPR